jgi:hypothetical protein
MSKFQRKLALHAIVVFIFKIVFIGIKETSTLIPTYTFEKTSACNESGTYHNFNKCMGTICPTLFPVTGVNDLQRHPYRDYCGFVRSQEEMPKRQRLQGSLHAHAIFR